MVLVGVGGVFVLVATSGTLGTGRSSNGHVLPQSWVGGSATTVAQLTGPPADPFGTWQEEEVGFWCSSEFIAGIHLVYYLEKKSLNFERWL